MSNKIMREQLVYWTTQLRQERYQRRKALADAPHKVRYHRQREGVMEETINVLKTALAHETVDL